MPALGHHPKHFRVLVLAQTDRTGRFPTFQVLGIRELWVRVDDVLFETNDSGIIVVVLCDEHDTGQHNAGRGRVGIWVLGRRAVARGAAADIGGE